MSGKRGTAPCGHPGEFVIGGYVKCPQCDVPKNAGHRGVPGHVERCACKQCHLRRVADTIVLRTDKGTDAMVYKWDGKTMKIPWYPQENATIRHWLIRDKDGNVLAKGNLDAAGEAGRTYKIVIEMMFDASAKLSVELDWADDGKRYWVLNLDGTMPDTAGADLDRLAELCGMDDLRARSEPVYFNFLDGILLLV